MKHKKTVTSVAMIAVVASVMFLGPVAHVRASEISAAQAGGAQIGEIGTFDGIAGLVGGLFAASAGAPVFEEVFNLLITQVHNLNEQQLMNGVWVLNATSSSTWGPEPYSEAYSYEIVAPFVDDEGNVYKVEVDRSVDVEITVTQELSVVIVIWDQDGSFMDLILRLLDLYNSAVDNDIGNNPTQDQQNAFIQDATAFGTYFLLHLNDFVTGDEQFIFQPTYYYSYNITGDIIDTRTWKYANNDTVVADPEGEIPGLSAAASSNDYLDYLMQGGANMTDETIIDTGFLFHIFQFWLQKMQIQLDLAKLGTLITMAQNNETIEDEAVFNVLEGIEVAFTFTQHHLLGGVLFDDIDGNGVPSILYNDTGYNYTDSSNETKSVIVPVTNEVTHIMDIRDPGAGGWDVKMPTVEGDGISWNVNFTNPTVKFRPLGMSDYDYHLSGQSVEYPMDYMYFGFTFEPHTASQVNVQGNAITLHEGRVKLDQGFGEISGLAPELADLSLAMVYFSHVFTFELDFNNIQTAQGQDVGNQYNQTDGTLDFLQDDATGLSYFASVDIAGPDYETRGSTYPAATAIVPLALFQYSFEGQQTVENDAFSISQGEEEYRAQTLFVGITSAWAFYCVAYPEWNGEELVHDPTFSIYMSVPLQIPWAIIIIVIVAAGIGVVAVAAFVAKKKKVPTSK